MGSNNVVAVIFFHSHIFTENFNFPSSREKNQKNEVHQKNKEMEQVLNFFFARYLHEKVI